MAAAAAGLSSLVCSSTSSTPQALSSSVSARQCNGFLGGSELGAICSARRRIPVSRQQHCGIRAVATAEAEGEVQARPMPRLKKIYLEKVVPALKEEFKYKNAMEVSNPKLAMSFRVALCRQFVWDSRS